MGALWWGMQSKTVKIFTTTVALLSLLFGCAKEGRGPRIFSELDGTWVSECDGAGRSIFFFIDNEIRILEENFTDNTCSILSRVVKSKYRYNLPGRDDKRDNWFVSSLEPLKSDNRIDYTTLESALATQTDPMTSQYNSQAYCGLQEWVTFSFKEINGRTCGSSRYLEKNTVSYNIFEINGEKLRFGDQESTTLASRPKILGSWRFKKLSDDDCRKVDRWKEYCNLEPED
jgi:hypothetical protein